MHTSNFPFPEFRAGQQEAINKFVEHFKNNGRFGALYAPLGSGKSPINYTIGSNFDKVVYLTVQKQLQDQIGRENWTGLRILKGRNAYPCAMHPEFNCAGGRIDDIGESRHMICQIKGMRKYPLKDFQFHEATINPHYEKYDPDHEVIKELQPLRDLEDPDYFRLLATICCAESRNFFCPYKLAKFAASRARIAVLNPDIYYALKKHAGHPFGMAELLIFDEAHKINEIAKRIFGVKINLKFFYKFNIKLKNFIPKEMDLERGFAALAAMLTGELGCYQVAAMMIEVLSKLLQKPWHAFESAETIDAGSPLVAEHEAWFLAFRTICLKHSDLSSPIFAKNLAVACVRELLENKPLSNFIANEFQTLALKPDNIAAVEEILDQMKVMHRHICKDIYEVSQYHVVPFEFMFDSETGTLTDEYANIDEPLNDLRKTVKLHMAYNAFAYKYEYDMSGNEYFVIDPVRYSKIMYHEVYQDPKPKLLNPDHPYQKKVMLSSGTWPYFESMVKWYGFNSQEGLLMHIVPPSFPDNRRPIFVCKDYTQIGFSAKVRGEYAYKTDAGQQRWSQLLINTVNYIQKRWEGRKRKVNIAIHTSSIALSEEVANLVLFGLLPCSYFFGHVGSRYFANRPKNKIRGLVDHLYFNKDKMVEDFCKWPNEHAIICSPSIVEGCDFKEEMCRAQIVLKRPTPAWGDLDVNLKTMGCDQLSLKKDSSYFDTLIMIAMNQIYGRVMRAENDYGETYLLDSDICIPLGLTFGDPNAKIAAQRRHFATKRNLDKMDISYFLSGVRFDKTTNSFVWSI